MENEQIRARILIPRRTVYLITALASLLAFLIFYIPESFKYYIDDWVLYLSYFIRMLCSTVLPALSALAILASSDELSWLKRIIPSVYLALPRLIYLLPYNYLYYMSMSYDSLDSLGLMLLRSAVEILIYSAEIYIYAAIGVFFFKKRAARGEDIYKKDSLFGFSSAASSAIIAICFSRFAVDLINEIAYVINYIIEYAETYRLGEVYFIIGKFLFILLSMILSYIALFYTKKLFKKRIDRALAS